MQLSRIIDEADDYTAAMPRGRPTQKERSPLGDRIVAARQQLGLSQSQLADKLGISQRALAHWEVNPVALRPEQLAALADGLQVSADYLLGREEKNQRLGPVGKTRRVFEQVSLLPRHQQDEAVKFLTRFVKGCQQDSAA